MPMDKLKIIADICQYLTIIVGFVAILKKAVAPLKNINERISKLEKYEHDNYMNTLRLTIMSDEMPLEERLNAGDKYVQNGGNGAVKAQYRLLEDQYERMH